MEKIIITPKTKVLELIENYPDLEQTLIDLVPTFSKLKNPILRKTIAKIATLQQAAAVGNVKIEELINALRQGVGQESVDNISDHFNYTVSQPTWFSKDKIEHIFDVREMLSRGEHPVNQVIADLSKFPSGKIYKLTASFTPAPLIDKASGLGFVHWIEIESDNLVHVYFTKL